MAKFSYKAKDGKGKTVKGTLESSSEKTAATSLRNQGYFVIEVRSPSSLKGIGTGIFSKGVNLSDVTNFTRQLSVMLSSGLTLNESLASLRNQTTNPKFEKVLSDLLLALEEGLPFSKALKKHENIFPAVYIAVIAAGESSGVLDKMLNRLADNLERERELRGKLKGALLYPMIILVAMGAVMAIMMVFVVPQLSTVYDQLHLELPLPTQIVVAISNFMVNFWYIAIGLIAGLVIGFRTWKNTPGGKRTIDGLMFKIPAIRTLQESINVAEFTRAFGLLIASGTPIIDSLTNVSHAMQNVYYGEAIARVAKKVEKGVALSTALSLEPVFPPLIAQMSRVGEETGKMDEVMLKITNFFEAETERAIKSVTTLIEPVLMVVLGIGVGFLMVSIIMPIYGITQAF